MASFFRRKDPAPGPASPGAPEGEDQAALLQRITSLKEKNERLEIRFRDVVGAYKSLMREKETLEKSLAATTSLVVAPRAAPAFDLREGAETSGTEDDGAAVDPLSETEGRGGMGPRVAQLQAQIVDLTRAVAETTQARSSDAALFAADKRATADAHRQALADLRAEMEAKLSVTEKCLADEREAAARELTRRAQQVADMAAAASSRQDAWDAERKTYAENMAAMGRQQQSGDSLTTRVRELGAQLQQARDAELAAIARLSDTTTGLKSRISALEEELAQTQARLASVAHQGDGEEILKLKQELRTARKAADAFREEARSAVQQQTLAIRTAQERVEASEQAMATLRAQLAEAERGGRKGRDTDEARVAELAQLLGDCTAARREESQANARLQQELADTAARAAADARRKDGEHAGAEAELQRQIGLLKEELVRAQQPPTTAAPSAAAGLADELPAWLAAPAADAHPDVIVARSEILRFYRQLQGMQEQMLLTQQQTRAAQTTAALEASFSAASPYPSHTTLPARTAAPPTLTPSTPRSLSSPPPSRVASFTGDRDRDERPASPSSSRNWRVADQARVEAEHARVLDEWSARFAKLRDRTTAMLQDKDEEIARLRRNLAALAGPPRAEGEDPSTLQSGAPVVAYSSLEAQLAREREVFRARVRELETAQVDEAEARALIEEQNESLKSEIRRLERSAGRSGANLEYLKNIVVKLLTHAVPRDRVIPVIARILQFSPDELRAVLRT